MASISGVHLIIYSNDEKRDRQFLKDILKLPYVDAGEGWLIFGLPQAEVAVHPTEAKDGQEFYLMCDDVRLFVAEMKRRKLACARIQDRGYGLVSQVALPGGGRLGVYQPRHPRPRPYTTKPSGRVQV